MAGSWPNLLSSDPSSSRKRWILHSGASNSPLAGLVTCVQDPSRKKSISVLASREKGSSPAQQVPNYSCPPLLPMEDSPAVKVLLCRESAEPNQPQRPVPQSHCNKSLSTSTPSRKKDLKQSTTLHLQSGGWLTVDS